MLRLQNGPLQKIISLTLACVFLFVTFACSEPLSNGLRNPMIFQKGERLASNTGLRSDTTSRREAIGKIIRYIRNILFIIAGIKGGMEIRKYKSYEPHEFIVELYRDICTYDADKIAPTISPSDFFLLVKVLSRLQENRHIGIGILSKNEKIITRVVSKDPDYIRAIILAANAFDIEPELLAGFLTEESLRFLSRNRYAVSIKEAISYILTRMTSYRGTIGEGQTEISYAYHKRFIETLYKHKEFLISRLSQTGSGNGYFEKFKSIINFYEQNINLDDRRFSEKIKDEQKVNLLDICDRVREIGIFLTGYVIRKKAEELERALRNEMELPNTSNLSRHSSEWLVREFMEIPKGSRHRDSNGLPIDLRMRYGMPFGNITFYHPLILYFMVARRYTGSIKDFSRAMGKVMAYLMFLKSGVLFREDIFEQKGPRPPSLNARVQNSL